MQKKYHPELQAQLQIYMHDITKHVLQLLFYHEIFQLQNPDPVNLAFSALLYMIFTLNH